MEAMLSSQHSFVSYLFRSKMSNQPVNGMIFLIAHFRLIYKLIISGLYNQAEVLLKFHS